MSTPRPASQAGFTLIELMVSLVVAMVILAGLYSNFIMQSRVQASQSSTVEAIEDLRLAAQIMGTQLRMAASICWDATNGLVYQPLGAVVMTGCATIDPSWGAFSFDSSTSTGGRLWWRRPNPGASAPSARQEVLRGLDPTNGFQVTTANTDLGALRTITLISRYQNADRQDKSLSISFDVLPRNH